MNSLAQNAPGSCKLCGATDLALAFTERDLAGESFGSWYCRRCELYQTLGEVAAVSPDYVGLADDDLDQAHVRLQNEQKHSAFVQWRALMSRHAGVASNAAGRPKTLLDIGCGVGGFLDYAAAQGLQTFGFDASAAQVARAAQRHVNVRMATDLVSYVTAIGHNEPFDYVTMWDVLEHIREPAPLLDAVAARLAPGGLMYVSVPSGKPTPIKLAIHRIAGTPLNLFPWEHVFYYTQRSLPGLLNANGLGVVEVGGVATYDRPLNAHEAIRRLGYRLLRSTPWAPQIYAVARSNHSARRESAL